MSVVSSRYPKPSAAWSTRPSRERKIAKLSAFEAGGYLGTPEEIAEFLNEALTTKDVAFVAKAIGLVARSRCVASVARKAGTNRENLYRSFGGSSVPNFGTVLSVLDAIGIQIRFKPKDPEEK